MKLDMQLYGKKDNVINRLIVTGIALLALITVTVLLAKILDEFVWHVPK